MSNTPPHILVVEDDRETRALIAKYLRGNNFNVATAQDGREMAKQLAEQRVDLVVRLAVPVNGHGSAVLR
mgnify:CR=1 FL=1